MPTKITYNGKTTEVSAGDIATIACKDYKMATDVVVEAPESEGESAKLYGIEVTPTKAIQNVLPEGGYDGFNEVIVNPIPDEYVIPNLIIKTITENGTYKASEEGMDSIVGTWVFNDIISADGLRTYNNNSASGIKYNFDFRVQGVTRSCVKLDYNTLYSRSAIGYADHSGSGSNLYYFYDADGNENYWTDSEYKTWTITSEIKVGANNVTEEIAQEFKTWLQANATKVSVDGYSEVIVNVASEQVEEYDGTVVI